MQKLKPADLNATISLNNFTFNSTADLLENNAGYQPNIHGWVAQSEAKKSALFGLKMQQSGFNVLVLGAQGSGRTSLMQSAMHEAAKQNGLLQNSSQLLDLVALYHFEQPNQPTLIKLPVSYAAKLRAEMDGFARALMVEMPNFVAIDNAQNMLTLAEEWLDKTLTALNQTLIACQSQLSAYFNLVKQEVLAYLKAWQPSTISESDNALEGLINEAFFARFRVNVLVDNRAAFEHLTPPFHPILRACEPVICIKPMAVCCYCICVICLMMSKTAPKSLKNCIDFCVTAACKLKMLATTRKAAVMWQTIRCCL